MPNDPVGLLKAPGLMECVLHCKMEERVAHARTGGGEGMPTLELEKYALEYACACLCVFVFACQWPAFMHGFVLASCIASPSASAVGWKEPLGNSEHE